MALALRLKFLKCYKSLILRSEAAWIAAMQKLLITGFGIYQKDQPLCLTRAISGTMVGNAPTNSHPSRAEHVRYESTP
jgi:hypothetical protein